MIEFLSNFLQQMGNVPRLSGVDHNNLANSVDTIMIKRLTKTNTLEHGEIGNQTHIAVTGDAMNIFDTLENSCNVVDLRHDNRFVKDFVVRNNVILLQNNIDVLINNCCTGNSNIINTYTHAAQTIRKSGAVQVEISYLLLDEQNFLNFRYLLNIGDYLIFLRKRNTFEFICLGIPNIELGESRVISL